MPSWERKEHKAVPHDGKVKCYQEGGFVVRTHDALDYQKLEAKDPDPYFKTYVIDCGMCDGERLDLFDLQDWFDRNRDMINALRKEVER